MPKRPRPGEDGGARTTLLQRDRDAAPETGTEQLDTLAVEWWGHVIRVRIADQRVMTGAIWLPVEDMRRR